MIADFICPTESTRAAFGSAFTIWVDRINEGRFADTNQMFTPPSRFDVRVTAEVTPQYWTEQALVRLRPAFDPQQPRALFIGRYQPFHLGHQCLIKEGIRRIGQACIAVRDTHGTDEKTRCHSSPSSNGSKPHFRPISVDLWWCLFLISPTSTMDAMLGTPLNALFLTRRRSLSPLPMYVGVAQLRALKTAWNSVVARTIEVAKPAS